MARRLSALSLAALSLAVIALASAARAQPPADRVVAARAAVSRMQAQCGLGPAVHAAFSVLSPPELDALALDPERMPRLLAVWERERRVSGGRLDPAGVTRFLRALETELGAPAPAWWQAALRSARFHPSTGATSYDVTSSRAARFSGTVAWGGRTLRAPAGIPDLAPIPPPRGGAPSHVDAIAAGARIVVVPFEPGSGGFPLEVRAYRAGPIEPAWTSTACSAGREMLSGLGDLVIQLDVVASELRVWSAESHGLAIDAFDLATGAPRWRFSTDFWFARQRP